LQVQAAAQRGVDFLTKGQLRTGAITDPLTHPARFLLAQRPSRASTFKAMGGADIWHTVSALAALARANEAGARITPSTVSRGEKFVKAKEYPGGGLSYWSTTRGLCCETTAFAASTIPSLRRSSLSLLQRVALPYGRWPQLLLERSSGYSDYSAAPSVTGWVLGALKQNDRLRRAGLAYLDEALGGRDIWEGHAGYYMTPLYPAHVASLSLRKKSVLSWVLTSQNEQGAWGYGPRANGPSSVLPTSFALLTLACFEPTEKARRAAARAYSWLLSRQGADGRFPLGPAPRGLWYSGDVYATAMALLALLGRKGGGGMDVS
jgi:hypothetical protein